MLRTYGLTDGLPWAGNQLQGCYFGKETICNRKVKKTVLVTSFKHSPKIACFETKQLFYLVSMAKLAYGSDQAGG